MPSTATVIDQAHYRSVMGHLPTGVVALSGISARHPHPCGLVVGTFQSLSLDPPLVTFSVATPRPAGRRCAPRAGCARACSRPARRRVTRALSSKQPDKFAAIDWSLSAFGSPRIDGAHAWIDCEIAHELDGGDHVIVIARVLHMQTGARRAAGLPQGPPRRLPRTRRRLTRPIPCPAPGERIAILPTPRTTHDRHRSSDRHHRPAARERAPAAAAAAAPLWEDYSPGDRAEVLVALADALDARVGRPGGDRRSPRPGCRRRGSPVRWPAPAVQLRMFAARPARRAPTSTWSSTGATPTSCSAPARSCAATRSRWARSWCSPRATSRSRSPSPAATPRPRWPPAAPSCVKAHPGHPRTSAATAAVVDRALAAAGGTGGRVRADHRRARRHARADRPADHRGRVHRLGRRRARAVRHRRRPRPARSRSTANSAASTRPWSPPARSTSAPTTIAAGFVGSFTLGAGQFCTKPGILLVPAGSTVDRSHHRTRPPGSRRRGCSPPGSPRATGPPRPRDRRARRRDPRQGNRIRRPERRPRGQPDAAAHHRRATSVAHAATLLEESFGPTAIIAEYRTRRRAAPTCSPLSRAPSPSPCTPAPNRPPTNATGCAGWFGSPRSAPGASCSTAGPPASPSPPPSTTAAPTRPPPRSPTPPSAAPRSAASCARSPSRTPPSRFCPHPLRDDNPLEIPRTVNPAGESVGWGRPRI